jgi:outer membrane receptor protein involved in Fe transport
MRAQIRNWQTILFASSALAATFVGGEAFAQAGAAPADPNQLEQVVVTATRQSDTVNRVPLSVTAATQKSLDQRGIRTIADLQGTVPGLRVGAAEGSGVTNIVIRGVRQSVGAATTGFYLDETPLQKRNAAGFNSVNGTPIPPLFDLDRVEVLRGPQGTLFGGGSEGGTVRYIQPQPSLTRYSVYSRAQYSGTDGGAGSYEAGVAVGGPLVQDKLGFRASIFGRKSGGYIDLVDYRNGQVYDANANYGTTTEARLALTWAPTENSKITGSYFTSRDSTHNYVNTVNSSLPGVLTAPSLCYNDFAISSLPLPGASLLRSFLGQGVPGSPMVTPGAACTGAPGTYKAPGFTIGPIALSGNQSLNLAPQPTATKVQIGTIDAEVDLAEGYTIKSITSYTQDVTNANGQNTFQSQFVSYAAAGGINYVAPGQATQNIASGIPYNPNITGTAFTGDRGAYLRTNTLNKRYGITEEVRLSSRPTATPFSFVAGIFYSNVRQNVRNQVFWNDSAIQQLTGMTTLQRYGVPNPGFFSYIDETDKDVEIAAFGEGTVHVTDKLRLIGGIRITHVTTDFFQTNFGPNANNNNSSVAAGTAATGNISESPITPKVSLQYSLNSNDLLYVTASKGFRAGGVNQVLTSVGAGLAGLQYGFTTADFPRTYKSDSVWSYEAGAKLRLWDGRAQLNGSIFRIDWTDIQTNVAFGGDGVIFNAPKARSQGGELEGQVRVMRNLTLDGSLAYDDAKYTADYNFQAGAAFRPLQVAANGNPLQVPKWTFDIGGRYDFDFTDVIHGYLRADYRWADSYLLNSPTDAAYTPDSSIVPAQKNLNLRLGVDVKDWDINVFANNVTNETAGAQTGGRSACTSAACATYANYTPFFTTAIPRPREIGVQVVYRH